MIKKIKFKNYRCFSENSIYFKDISIIVGKNNAGKSTIIEALRLIAFASKKCTKTTYIDAPKSLGLPKNIKGFKINPNQFKIDLRGIIHYYGDTNAIVEVDFENKVKVVLYLNKETIFSVIYDSKSMLIKNKFKAMDLNLDVVDILPQIGLIKENEKKLSELTVVSDVDTYLSSRHFRNEILLKKDEVFGRFKELAEKTWQGLKLSPIEYIMHVDEYIQLYVEDDRFTAEIGLMGSGLQMWLQIIWFISRTKGSTTAILDEPDVYMHPDLQRKLLVILREYYPQIIIATHSVEIISQVEAKNILNIDKKKTTMKYADSKKSVQTIIDSMGSVHNLSLLRLSTAKKFIFCEGDDDLKLLSKLYRQVYPKSDILIDIIPNSTLGGHSKFADALSVAKLFHSETNGNFSTYCILDSDYFNEQQLKDKHDKAVENNLILHIWSKKEIENYFLIPKVIFRLTGQSDVEYTNFLEKMNFLVDHHKDNIIDQISNQLYYSYEKKKQIPNCNQEARKLVEERWTTLESKLSLVGGKEFISDINKFIKEEYGKKSSLNKIIEKIKLEDICVEMREVLEKISS